MFEIKFRTIASERMNQSVRVTTMQNDLNEGLQVR